MAAIAATPPRVELDLLQEAWSRVTSGKFIILSWQALEILLQDDRPRELLLTPDLIQRCSFVAKEAFSSPDAFRAAVIPTNGFEPTDAKKSLIAEEFKLRRFIKEELLASDERIFVSNDLIDDLAGSAMTPQLLGKCVLVSKQIFDPKNRMKLAFEVNEGEPYVQKVDKLSTAIRGVLRIREANQLVHDEEPIAIMSTILVRSAE